MSLKVTTVISEIQNALISSGLFESSTEIRKQSNYSVLDGNKKFHYFFFPKKIERDAIDGFKLKNNKGHISIHEIYEYTNRTNLTRIYYIYRYITSEFTYDCTYSVSKEKLENIQYGFHFDMDLAQQTSNHPSYHLQVLHTHPRFSTGEIHIFEFLQEVKKMCFEDSDLSKPYNLPIFSIK